jgi:hypothetical protein
MGGGFKKRDLVFFLIVILIIAGVVVYYNWEPSVTIAEKANWSNTSRYENTDFGFSVEYDADLLTKTPARRPPGNVFLRTSDKGWPSMGIYVGKYPGEKTFEETIPMTYKALKRFFPKGKIHDTFNAGPIQLMDGTDAFYYEIKFFSGKDELMEALVVAKEFDKMITVYAMDTDKGSMDTLKALVQSLKLDVEIDFAALKAKGVSESGKLERTAVPSFTMTYPKTFENLPLQEGQIFRVGVPDGIPVIEIGFYAIKKDQKADDQIKGYAGFYAKAIEAVGSDIKLVSNKAIKNYKKYPAYQFVLEWKFQARFPLTTVGHVILKNDHAITFVGHGSKEISVVLDIFKSINLDP